MPLILGVLCILAIAYRYYSAFLAAKVLALDDANITPAHKFNDGQNYHPTNKWITFGHHFAAISGAGPLIGPVLAIQYGYMPGLLWLVIGVCLAGAVQDMLVLGASVRRGGKSLAEIARTELGPFASGVTSLAILFIVVIALAGLGFVVVKALGGESVPLAEGTKLKMPGNAMLMNMAPTLDQAATYNFPAGTALITDPNRPPIPRANGIAIEIPPGARIASGDGVQVLPAGSKEIVPGSSWGTFTIACPLPIALFVGWYMYRLRPGRVVEAWLFGAGATLAAGFVGHWVPD